LTEVVTETFTYNISLPCAKCLVYAFKSSIYKLTTSPPLPLYGGMRQ